MYGEDKVYLKNKHKLIPDRQEELEKGFDIFFDVCIKDVVSWYPLKTGCFRITTMTRQQIIDAIRENLIVEIREAYPLGFNYDIDGNRM